MGKEELVSNMIGSYLSRYDVVERDKSLDADNENGLMKEYMLGVRHYQAHR